MLLGIVLRHLLVPSTFGDRGFYRAASLSEHMSMPLVHGLPTSCAGCHQDQQEAIENGTHASVSCEVCHAPLALHANPAEDPTGKFADMPMDRTYRSCAYCHMKVLARPNDFPQIDFEEHLITVGAIEPPQKIPARACLYVCHTPHSPGGVSNSSK
jgi:hypothetical protein